jgi:two-component system LytT family sensor kinase
MKKNIPFYYHLLIYSAIWLIHSLWQTALGPGGFEELLRPDFGNIFKFTYHLSIFGLYLLNYYLFCRFLLGRGRYALFLLSIPLSLALFTGFRYLIEEVAVFHLTGKHNYFEASRQLGHYLMDNAPRALGAVFQSTIVFLIWAFYQKQREVQQMQLSRQEADLQLLRSQISPHFLFNTLNMFYSDLQDKQPETAAGLMQLADMLRYTLSQSGRESVSLREELDFIGHYIRLNQKRFDEGLCLDFQVNGAQGERRLSPAMLIHFVENVFKHGLLSDPAKPASIRIDIGEDFLEIRTRNHINPAEQYSPHGLGFENLEKRLQILYAGRFSLERKSENGVFYSYLKMPFHATA